MRPRRHRLRPRSCPFCKAIHGGKAKNDKIDSHKIGVLLRAGALPQAYVYPPGMRATRDLLRRRLFFVRKRGELFAHVRTTHHQYNLPAPSGQLLYQCNRARVPDAFHDPIVRTSVEADLALANHYDGLIRSLERTIVKQAKIEDPSSLDLLQTIPGVGPILVLFLRKNPRGQKHLDRLRSKHGKGKALSILAAR